MARKPESTALVASCLQALGSRGVIAWRNNSTGVWDPRRQVFRTFKGRKGVSDILGIVPRTRDGRRGVLIAVECKHGTARLTPEQKVFLEDVERAGGFGLVVHTIDELLADLAVIVEYWIPEVLR